MSFFGMLHHVGLLGLDACDCGNQKIEANSYNCSSTKSAQKKELLQHAAERGHRVTRKG